MAEFTTFSKKSIVQMRKMLENFNRMKNVKENNIIDYRTFVNVLDKYEGLNMNCYVNGDLSQLVINDTNNTQIKDGMDSLVRGLRNPFMTLYNWSRGDVSDLEAVMEAIALRDHIGSLRSKTELQKKATQSDLDNMQVGKKTIRTVFKK